MFFRNVDKLITERNSSLTISREMLSSNLGRDTCYPDMFTQFSSDPLSIYLEYTSNRLRPLPYKYVFNSSVFLTLKLYIAATESLVDNPMNCRSSRGLHNYTRYVSVCIQTLFKTVQYGTCFE